MLDFLFGDNDKQQNIRNSSYLKKHSYLDTSYKSKNKNEKNRKYIKTESKVVENISDFNEKAEHENSILESRNVYYDITAIALFLIAFISLISFISMNASDSFLFSANTNTTAHNMLGKLGVIISSYSFLAFGFVSYIIVPTLILIASQIILKNSLKGILKIILPSLSSIICMTIFLDIVLGNIQTYKKGGVMGSSLRGLLKSFIGDIGIIILIFFTATIMIAIFSRISLKNILSSFLDKLIKINKNKNVVKKENTQNEENTKGEIMKDIKNLKIVEKKTISNLQYKVAPFISLVKVQDIQGIEDIEGIEETEETEDIKENYFDSEDNYDNDSEYENTFSKKDYAKDNNREKRLDDILSSLNINNGVNNKAKTVFDQVFSDVDKSTENEIQKENIFDKFDKKLNIKNDAEEDYGYLLTSAVFGKKHIDSTHSTKYTTYEDYEVYKEEIEKNKTDIKNFNDKENDGEKKYSTVIGSLEEYRQMFLKNKNNYNKNNEDNTENYDKKYDEDKYSNYKSDNEIIDSSIILNKKNAPLSEMESVIGSDDKKYNEEKQKKPFEFDMGYASFREYNREDHIPEFYQNKKADTSDINIYEDDKESDYKEKNIEANFDPIKNKFDAFLKKQKREINENKIITDNNYNKNYEEEKYSPYLEEDGIKKNSEISSDEELIEYFNSVKENKLNRKENIEIEDDYKYSEELKELKEIEERKLNRQTEKQTEKVVKKLHLNKNEKTSFSIFDYIQSNFDSKDVDKNYISPTINLLKRSIVVNDNEALNAIKQTATQLEHTLLDFSIEARVTGVSRGPVVTRYELELAAGTRVSKIVNLTDNIALALASESVRIIAPIPGRSVVGIEIPNKVRSSVYLRDVLESDGFKSTKNEIPFVLGKGIYGNNIVTDLSEAPHLLVAGTTGSGKSVCLSTIILSLLFKFRPDELKFIFIDKKRVELSIYNGIPHLMAPVVSDEKKATVVLRHIVEIMERRYERMEKFFVRNVKAYNEKVRQLLKDGESEFDGEPLELFPYIIVVIDELHNLMVVASKEVEDLISRLAGMSRAVGIHLIIATQRPSADVVTGVIKANLPTRIAFQVPNKINSRIIIDMAGAEQLLGKGDALFCSAGNQMPERVQGAFVSDGEVKKVVDYLSSIMEPIFDESLIASLEKSDNSDKDSVEEDILDEELWEDAVRVISRTRKASASFLQRKLKIGYNRAARIVELMEQQGLVGPENGSKPREVLVSYED